MPTQSATSRPAAAVVAVTPLVLITAFVLHPHLPGRQPNIEALAQAVSSDPTRWGLVHLATGLGSALLAVAFLMISNYLRRAGEDRWSAAGLPLIIVGCTLYAMLPAMEFAPPRRGRVRRRPRRRPACAVRLVPANADCQWDHLRCRSCLLRGEHHPQRCLGTGCHTVGCGSLGHHGAVSLRALVSSPVLRAGPGLLCGDAAAGVRHVAAFRVRSGVARGVAADSHRTGRRLNCRSRAEPRLIGHEFGAVTPVISATAPAWQRISRCEQHAMPF